MSVFQEDSTPNHSHDEDAIDQEWLARFCQDGFTAEELNDVLSAMVLQIDAHSQQDMYHLNHRSGSDLDKISKDHARKNSADSVDSSDSSSTSSSEAGGNEMKDCGTQTGRQDLGASFVIDENVKNISDPQVRGRQ